MKQHIISLPHHPKRVIVISLIIAIAIGIFGYLKINQKVVAPDIKNNSNMSTEDNSSASHNLTLGFLAGGRIKSVSVKAGDIVKKGQVLATLDAENTLGVLAQAKAAYKTAEANYKKIINGATSTAIDVAKATVHTAEVNLEGLTKQQNILVENARANLLNSTLVAESESDNSLIAPSITGTYTKDVEGSIILNIYQTGNGGYVSLSGIISGTVVVSTTTPQAIGDTGLFIKFSTNSTYFGTAWRINIPNKTASNYLANFNAYQSALQNQSQIINSAQAVLNQANASLVALSTTARPEDVAVAQAQVDNASGAVQIAEAALQNTIIVAPSDGTVTSVAITPGQIAAPNVPAIEFISSILVN